MSKCKCCGQEISLPLKTCPECLTEFEPKRTWQVYCNPDCRSIAHRKRRELIEDQRAVEILMNRESPRALTDAEYEAEAAAAFKEIYK